jgi:transcriptional regulator with XRE-family HTH domain
MKKKTIKKKVKKAKKVKKVKKAKKLFDYSSHNKKIAALRGKSWKSALVKAKFEAVQKPSLMKLRRVNLGMSQLNLLSKCPSIGSITALRKIENGVHKATHAKANEIATALKLKIGDLFTLKGNRYSIKGADYVKFMGKKTQKKTQKQTMQKEETPAKPREFNKAKSGR